MPDPRDTTKTLDLRMENFVRGPDGTWLSERSESYADGKLRIREEYSDVKFNTPLDPRMFAIP